MIKTSQVRKCILSLLLVFLWVYGNSQNTGVNLQSMQSFEKALSDSKQSEKLIMIYCHAKWCGYCGVMEKKVFSQDNVGNYFNEHFINYSVDIDKEEAGKYIKAKYEVRALPTVLFINEDGELIHKIIGYKEKNEFIELAKNAFDSINNLNYYQKKVESGDYSPNTVSAYLKINSDYINRFEIVDSCLKSLPPEKAFSKEAWDVITSSYRIANRYRKYLLNHENEFKENVDSKVFDNLIEELYSFYIYRYWNIFGERKRQKAIQQIKDMDHHLSDRIIKAGNFVWANQRIYSFKRKSKKRWRQFVENYHAYLSLESINEKLLIDGAKTIYFHQKKFKDKESLIFARSMMETKLPQDIFIKNIELYSLILVELGEKEKALATLSAINESPTIELNSAMQQHIQNLIIKFSE
ncbi:MAG: thioredoxin family protein [Bacteroidetes bacterium]|nr:thioredoxin family protein [Bacteroidota bacterium]